MKLKAIAVAAATLVLILVAQGLAPREALAAVTTFEVTATGAEEVPAVVGPVSAFARFSYDDVARTLDYAVTVSGASPDFITAAHIHRGARGVNGPIIHNISTTGFTQASGRINLSAGDVQDLLTGDFYLNVHTRDHPGGAARGQLFVPTTAAIEALYRRFVDIGNRGDLEAVLAFYAPNATFSGGTVCVPQPCAGRAAIRRHFENVVATRTDIRNVLLSTSGNQLRFRTDVTNDATRAAGVSRIIVTGTVAFAGSTIDRHTVAFDPTDPETARFLAFVASRMGAPGGSVTPPSTGNAGLITE
jgi:hypothetical protein